MEDRCTPSVLGGGLAAPSLAHHGRPHAGAAARVRAAHGHAVPIKTAFRCSVDFSALTVNTTGFASGGVGRWTALGHIIDKPVMDPVADLGVYSGTGTLVTAKGDRLFFSFTTSWQLSTGKGTHFLIVTGGTGRFAGASGSGSVDCTLTPDPASPTTFRCKSAGSGTLFLAHP
jgi:hypothetical protein